MLWSVVHRQENQRRENALGHAHQKLYKRKCYYIIWLHIFFFFFFLIFIEFTGWRRARLDAAQNHTCPRYVCRILAGWLLSIKGEDKPGGWWLSCANFPNWNPTSTPAELLYVKGFFIIFPK